MADLFHMPRPYAADTNGDPRAGAKLYFYASGTSTPQAVYTTQALSVAHANPVVANASGVWAAIWLQDLDYTVVLKDSSDVTIWTEDNVHGASYDPPPAVDDSSPLGFIGGFELSAGSDANNDTTVATGAARDSTNTITITTASALTKQLDAAWAVGTNQGGLDTGTKANSSTYYVHAIRRASDGQGDILYSLSEDSPTLPTGWTVKRAIGSVTTDSSGNVSSRTSFSAGQRVATQAEMETGTAMDRSVSPGRLKYSPYAAKAWANFDGTGTPAFRSSAGFSSITDVGTGQYRLNFSTALTSGYAAIPGRAGSGLGSTKRHVELGNSTTAYVEILTGQGTTMTAEDASLVTVVVYGDL